MEIPELSCNNADYTQTHTHTQLFNSPLSGTTRVGRFKKKHSPTRTHPVHQTSITFLHLLRSTASSLFNLRAWQSFSTTSLQVLFGLSLLHTPCISSPDHHLLFTTHAHTNAACSAVIPMLCHLFLVSLSQLLTWESVFYLNATHPPDHSHLCSLKCRHVFFPYRPDLTCMQHAASHTTTVQPSSHNQ